MAQVSPEFTQFETLDASLDVDAYGAATCRVSYYARTDEIMLTLLKSGVETCPFVTNGMLATARFERGEAETIEAGWKVNLIWLGIPINLNLNESAVPEYQPTAQTQPIESHPLFESFAGTPDNTKNDAVYDNKGNFVKFPTLLANGEKNPKGGVKRYYEGSLRVTEKRGIELVSVQAEADYFNIGKIDIPDVEGLLKIKLGLLDAEDEDRDYLFTSIQLDDMGNGLAMMVREWDQSGPNGWDVDIYDYADTGDASTPTPAT